MRHQNPLSLWVVALLFTCTLPLYADDPLEVGRQEVAKNPEGWHGHWLMGQGYQSSGKADDAWNAYLSSWKFLKSKDLQTADKKDTKALAEALLTLTNQRLSGKAEAAAQKELEIAVLTYYFAPPAIADNLLERYANASNWQGVYTVLAIAHSSAEKNRLLPDESVTGKIHYVEGKAAEAVGDLYQAYLSYGAAKDAGLDPAAGDAARLMTKMETMATTMIAEAKTAFDKGDFKLARQKYAAVLGLLPAVFPERDAVRQHIPICDAAIAIEAAIQTATSLKAQGNVRKAQAVLDESLNNYLEDPRPAGKRPSREKLKAEVDQLVAKLKAAENKADEERRAKADHHIASAKQLAGQGKFDEALDQLDQAQKLGTTADIARIREDIKHEGDLKDRYDRGLAALKEGKGSEAVKLLQSVLTEDDAYGGGEIVKSMALAYFATNDNEKALKLADRYLLQHEDKEILSKAAASYESHLETASAAKKATDYLVRLEKLNPNDPTVAERLANVRWETNKLQRLGGMFLGVVVVGSVLLGVILKLTGRKKQLAPRTTGRMHVPRPSRKSPGLSDSQQVSRGEMSGEADRSGSDSGVSRRPSASGAEPRSGSDSGVSRRASASGAEPRGAGDSGAEPRGASASGSEPLGASDSGDQRSASGSGVDRKELLRQTLRNQVLAKEKAAEAQAQALAAARPSRQTPALQEPTEEGLEADWAGSVVGLWIQVGFRLCLTSLAVGVFMVGGGMKPHAAALVALGFLLIGIIRGKTFVGRGLVILQMLDNTLIFRLPMVTGLLLMMGSTRLPGLLRADYGDLGNPLMVIVAGFGAFLFVRGFMS
jgi:tetratricopeptide (TPR) repeat protein